MKIVQYVQTLARGDAVSNDARAIRRLLARQGLPSTLVAESILSPESDDRALLFERMPRLGAEDVLIYHHSTATGRVEELKALPCRKMMIYHNVTPAAFFAPYDLIRADECRRGRAELLALRDCFSYAMAVSDYNRAELLEAGYRCPVEVQPILIPFEDYQKAPDAATVARYGDGRTNLLFVGRVAPNKRQEKVIAAFDCYKKTFDPTARLILVGSETVPRYSERLRAYIAANGIEDVVFPGHIRFDQILAFYRTASVFLCMSEHEGFCVPLLEAMSFDVPVLAYAAAAVPDTLGGSGLLLEDSSPQLAAAAIERVLRDEPFRRAILRAQRERLADFAPERVEAQFFERFGAFLAGEKERADG